MKITSVAHYVSPSDHTKLSLVSQAPGGTQFEHEFKNGQLVSETGAVFAVQSGIPNFLYPETLNDVEASTKTEYDRVADDIYDRAVDWQFAAFLEDEAKVREAMVDLLRLKPGARVLEIGCGTGRDSFRIARRLGQSGELHMQDLSPRMVQVCTQKMHEYAQAAPFQCKLEYSVSNAMWLPYLDNTFDAVFHFGGFNHFGDLKRGGSELARVAKPGGRVLYGDEAVAPWLKGTEFDGIVSTNNALFKADIPLTSVPVGARDVSAHWFIANCFYVIAFTKGEGAPPLNLDLPHTGVRGGSLRSRYFGVLEGITPETKDLVNQAARKAGMSISEWLDERIKASANTELES